MSLTEIRGQTAIKNLKLNQEKTTFQTIQMDEELIEGIYLHFYFWELSTKPYQTWLLWSIRKNFSAKKVFATYFIRSWEQRICCSELLQLSSSGYFRSSLPYKSEDNLLFLYFHYALRKKNTNLHHIHSLYWYSRLNTKTTNTETPWSTLRVAD